MLYWPTITEGLVYLKASDTAWTRRHGPGWYVGTDEHERKSREAEQEFRDALDAMSQDTAS